MKYWTSILILVLLASVGCSGQSSASDPSTLSWSKRIAESFIERHPDAVTYDSVNSNQKWNYEQGLMLVALLRMWKHSGDNRYFDFVQRNLDRYVMDDGMIRMYKRTDYNLDNIGPGRALLAIYQKTKQRKYRAAADTLRRQLREQPRTNEGGFWHKKIYPYQMWLDGLFMAEPFYATYAAMFDEQSAFDDIAAQFIWIARHTKDSTTGLLYHGWDESKEQKWSNPTTGCSPSFWGRAMGWYAMGLVDVLDYFPPDHPKRSVLIGLLRDLASAVLKYEDQKSHLWYQVVDQGSRSGNYLEASASCMFAYAFAKGVIKGYLGKEYLNAAMATFRGVIDRFVTVDSSGLVDLHGTCRSAGLGGTPYRDGSYEYYISELQRTNDLKGIGPFLLAAIELEEGTTISTNTH
jgi:unsaturated rhamnogalacturonyl hydrolase